jgi:hypothetical protein
MNSKKLVLTAFFSMMIFAFPTKVHAESEYEEITYDDLVNRIDKKRTVIQSNTNHPLDNIMLHAGFGLVTSFTNLNIGDKTINRQQNGFQITAGIDLFSPDWMAEGAIVNFGSDSSGTEQRNLHELDMKVVYKNHLAGDTIVRYGFGFATRQYKFSDSVTGANYDESTPAWLGSVGVESMISKYFGIAGDLGLKSAMVSRTIDKNAIDFAIRFNSYF